MTERAGDPGQPSEKTLNRNAALEEAVRAVGSIEFQANGPCAGAVDSILKHAIAQIRALKNAAPQEAESARAVKADREASPSHAEHAAPAGASSAACVVDAPDYSEAIHYLRSAGFNDAADALDERSSP